MSFCVNDTNLRLITFNGKDVNEAYYNDTLVWSAYENWEWSDWESATWQDIYFLTKQKREGIITAYPTDVVLGATKTLTLFEPILGNTSIDMAIIGIDHDGDGVLTFESTTVLNEKTVFGSSVFWKDSTVRQICQQFYECCQARPYIKQLSKGTCVKVNGATNNYPDSYTLDYVWLLSESETGNTNGAYAPGYECTQGVSGKYPSYRRSKPDINGESAKRWVRSRFYMSDVAYGASEEHTMPIIKGDGWFSTSDYYNSHYIAPAFAIG